MSLDPQFPFETFPPDPRLMKLAGVYPQRQEGLYMQRVRIPGGRLNARHWRAVADVARQYSPETPLHLTTRQDLEFHNLSQQAVVDVQQGLAAAGLTGLGSGGDTARNITVCPCSGAACPDLGPLAAAIQQEFDRFDRLFSLPRKFKVSLSGSRQCGQPFLNDLAFVAQWRGDRLGLEVIGAGSLGVRPATGIVLQPWAELDDVLPLTAAALQLFDREGNRENRGKARLRHVRERLGDSEFLRRIQLEFEAVRAGRSWPNVEAPLPKQPKQERLSLVFANGDVTPDAADALAVLADDPALAVRIGVYHQVLVFAENAAALRAVGKHESLREAARPQAVIVACPGSRWCSRGVANTAALADRIRHEVPLAPGTVVSVSGCPNGCPHVAVAPIGLSGRVGIEDGQRVELFDLRIGGELGRSDKLAQPAAQKLTAEKVIEHLKSLAQSQP